MKKHIYLILITVIVFLMFALPVSATDTQASSDLVIDDADLLTDEQESIYETTAQRILDEYGLYMYLVTVEDATEVSTDIYEATFAYTEIFNTYDNFGVVMLIDEATNSFFYYDTSVVEDYIDDTELYINSIDYFATGRYDAFIDDYYRIFETGVQTFYAQLDQQQSAIDNIVVSNVMDTADLLTDSQEQTLQQMADEIKEQDMMEVYILTVQDYTIIEDSYYIEDAAMKFYTDYDLGYGETKDGVLLILSMQYRDYSYASYGDRANSVYTDSDKIRIENVFLGYFADNDWYNGFYRYMELSGKELNLRWYDHVFRFISPLGLVICLGIGFILAMGLASGHKKKLKSVMSKVNADDYVPKGGVNINIKEDQYTHTTTSRVRINTSSGGSSGGGRSFSSGGFSGRSGKF